MWYEWNSIDDFNIWHNFKCIELGIPNGLTTAYTQAYEVDDKWIAVVHDSEAEGLIKTELRLPNLNLDRDL